jgi:hypothetical protein
MAGSALPCRMKPLYQKSGSKQQACELQIGPGLPRPAISVGNAGACQSHRFRTGRSHRDDVVTVLLAGDGLAFRPESSVPCGGFRAAGIMDRNDLSNRSRGLSSPDLSPSATGGRRRNRLLSISPRAGGRDCGGRGGLSHRPKRGTRDH